MNELQLERRGDTLDELLELGILSELDYHFARTMARLIEEPSPPEVLLGLAVATRAVGLGHICADLDRIQRAQPLDRNGQPTNFQFPAIKQWSHLLESSPLVSAGEPQDHTPLVLDSSSKKLYLARYWDYQRRLIETLNKRASVWEEIDGPTLSRGLRRYFGPHSVRENHQKLAAMVALLRNFSVITGGPGTGKTTTVVKILALLLEQAEALGKNPPRILLLAPTGKAAARLGESIKMQKDREVFPCSDHLLAHIPEEAATIHRALGWQPDKPTRFQHNEDNPLVADVVLVDEASMVDVGLFAKLVAAIPARARFILLGDKDQLASVEAGAVLGDICSTVRGHRLNTFSAQFLEKVGSSLDDEPPDPGRVTNTGIWDSLVHLTHSYRFSEKSGIGRLARSIQSGRGERVIQALREDEGALLFQERDIRLVSLKQPRKALAALDAFIREELASYLDFDDPAEVLSRFSQVRLLCAHRRGPMGVESINAHVERLLGEMKLIRSRDPFYLGRPVMINRNDYQFNLFNGDIGIVWKDEVTRRPMTFFPREGREPRKLAPGHLPSHETVYAMTVHKSQGSEFNHVALLLPPEQSPILTRELIYTGVTRARHKVTIFADEDVLRDAIGVRIQRASGLHDALWQGVSQGKATPAKAKGDGGWGRLQLTLF